MPDPTVRERVIRVSHMRDAGPVVAFARAHGCRARIAIDDGRASVLVTCNRDFAWLCEHVAADETPAPLVFRADPDPLRHLPILPVPRPSHRLENRTHAEPVR